MSEIRGDLGDIYTLRLPEWTNLPVSVDIESVGLADSAPIFAIGAVRFNEDGSALPEGCPGEFYQLINLRGQGPVDLDTLNWWLNQGSEARAELAASGSRGDSLSEALWRFREWLTAGYLSLGLHDRVFEGKLWFRGNRDSAWLEHSYKACGLEVPFRYGNVRDQRSIIDFAQNNLHMEEVWQPRETPMHHALYDARYQAECLQAVLKRYPTVE